MKDGKKRGFFMIDGFIYEFSFTTICKNSGNIKGQSLKIVSGFWLFPADNGDSFCEICGRKTVTN